MIPNPLIPGAVYQTTRGPAIFRKLDFYHGETTYEFEFASGASFWNNQEAMKSFILPTGADK